MRITSMDVFPIRMALHEPIPMANGAIESTGNVLVKMHSDDGVVGWGEGVEAPALTGHRQVDIVGQLRELEPLVVGADPTRINDLWRRVRERLPDASTALGAIDIAVHDLVGKTYGVPAHALMGGVVRERVPALALLGSGDTDRDIAKLDTLRESGYSWFKIKVGMAPANVERRTIEHVIDAVGESGVVCADANGAWEPDEAGRFLDGLDGMPVRFVEQPIAAGNDATLVRIAERSPIPICADESATTLQAIVGFAGSALGGVSVKLIKHGGMTGVMRAGGICSAAGLGVNLAGKVIESSISAAANLHCAAALDEIEYGCSPANRGLVLDVTDEPVRPDGGEFEVPMGPGLGIEVNEESIVRLSD